MARLLVIYDPTGEASVRMPDKPPLGLVVVDVRETPENIRAKAARLQDLVLGSIPDKTT